MSDESHFAAIPDVLVGENLSFFEIGPVANRQERGAGTVNENRHPIPVMVNDLHAGADHRRDVANGRTFSPNRLAVLRSQRQDAAAAEADASAGRSSWLHQKHVGTHTGNGLLDGRGRSLAD